MYDGRYYRLEGYICRRTYIEYDCGDWLTGILLQNVCERRTLKRTHSKASTYKICRHPLLLR